MRSLRLELAWGRMDMGLDTMGLRHARMATMTTLRMPARRMGIMGRAGLAAGSLSALGRGSAAGMASVAAMGMEAVLDMATVTDVPELAMRHAAV